MSGRSDELFFFVCFERPNVTMVQKYEEIVANMTKPLGITIEESTDKARLVYITSVGEKVHWLFVCAVDAVDGFVVVSFSRGFGRRQQEQ